MLTSRLPLTLLAAAALAAAGCGSNAKDDAGQQDCTGCHGGRADGAPSDAAHEVHLDGGALSRPVACAECHPASSSPRHRDGSVQVTFGAFASTGGRTPTFSGNTCSGVYCHGSDGSASSPVWTRVDGSQTTCGGCHANPPSAGGHPQVEQAYCAGCHAATVNATGALVPGGAQHLDGSGDATAFSHPGTWLAGHQPAALPEAEGCVPCHGGDLRGGTSGVSCWSCHPTGPPL